MHPSPCKTTDQLFLEAAVEQALQAEQAGNLPIGSVIVLDGEIISRGQNALLVPEYQPGAHAEIQALRSVRAALWPRAAEMTCYTSLEPCLMCFGTLLLHGVGRIVFGGDDPEGGFRWIVDALPPYYHERRAAPEWSGPLWPECCDELYLRAQKRFIELPCG